MGGRGNDGTRRRGRRRGRRTGVQAPPAGRDVTPTDVWDRLGGYRLLRAIGRGERSAAYLATGDQGRVVVKAYDPDADRDRLADEVASLTAIDSPHVVALLDVVAVPGERHGIVLERLSSVALADWLRDRRGILDTGEVVTAAVSVVRAVRAVHAGGWAHRSVSAANIRFDEAGCPVLLGFTDAVRATPSTLVADWEQCHGILKAILAGAESLDPDDAERVMAAIRGLGSVPDQEQLAVAAVERALFSLGPPAPLPLSGPAARAEALSAHPRTSASTVPSVTPASDGAEAADGRFDQGRPSALHRIMELASVAMEHGLGGVAGPRLRRFANRHRRPIVVATGAAIAVTVVALLVVPTTPAGHAEPPAPAPTASVARTTRAATPPAGERQASNVPDPAAAHTPAASAQAVVDEDPVRAAHRLLQRRQRCLADHDTNCLTDIDQPGSPLLDADRALAAGKEAPEPAPSLSRLSLSETMGDAAIVAIAPADETTKPATVLLIRTEAGWRLRALFED
jgi:hypothetical protein